MRIALVARLAEAVPPKLYGGTERVVSWLKHHLRFSLSSKSANRAPSKAGVLRRSTSGFSMSAPSGVKDLTRPQNDNRRADAGGLSGMPPAPYDACDKISTLGLILVARALQEQ